ncbi:dihydrolipoamide acetyltransferase family protein [Candidatus Phytoplasma solani]|uniref:Dihydrolipoamide acetyltransferase component of pyruvate dehydrogenase complex n=3 Tax=Candidatus Phytoplasma solani TaxID=69896 RepID=A0A421NYV8_9MOLU|nr:dihydrolipoamide acetyltransferase family protein [Candidatus Phytoplasma solani]RMI89191.1 branched-chain alpha-keto acid dehydrogenase subunit E2 [Candidatus Phytoplasma solani]RMI89209.1 branched-chain alpha-keto acid dehydrogenase subunit E2 [Candidatus Phytoplasma solani]CCP88503.1 branched-chain alpha-keto acid dehydrogenase subunit E2 (AceF, PdhC) [Candidatus Phytoplasma solani]
MFEFKFADVGEGIHEGTITRWFFKIGDSIKEGDILVKVETDKLDVELTSPVTGTILNMTHKEGDVINVGETLVLIKEPGDSDAVVKQTLNSGSPTVSPTSQQHSPSAQASFPTATITQTKILATPLVRCLAKELGIDLATIKGTGIDGKILKEDIIQFQQKTSTSTTNSFVSQPAPLKASINDSAQTEIIKISRLRKAIAQKMVLAKSTIPETTLIDEVNITALVALRKQAKVQAEKQGIKLTFMAFIMKAVAIALEEFPVFNASFDDARDEIILKKFINLGIAVDTKDGLIVPNVKNANKFNLLELAKKLQEAAQATIERKVQLDALQNGTFTITNFGSLDISYGTPVINYPELAILGVGKISKKPIVENNQIIIADMLPLSLAIDHRIIDGADGGRFLKRIKELLSLPTLLLLS